MFYLTHVAIFWIEEAQYKAFEEESLIITVHRDGYLRATDTLSKYTHVSHQYMAILDIDCITPSFDKNTASKHRHPCNLLRDNYERRKQLAIIFKILYRR